MRRNYSLPSVALLAAGCASLSSLHKPYVSPYSSPSKLERLCIIKTENLERVNVAPQEVSSFDGWNAETIQLVEKLQDKPYEVVQKEIHTPEQAAAYVHCTMVHGGNGFDDTTFGRDFWMSGKLFNFLKWGDCDDFMVEIASLLKDDGFPAYGLRLYAKEKCKGITPRGNFFVGERNLGHVVFLYATDKGTFGTIGSGRCDTKPAIYKSMDELITALSLSCDYEITNYKIYHISKAFPDYDTNLTDNSPEQEIP